MSGTVDNTTSDNPFSDWPIKVYVDPRIPEGMMFGFDPAYVWDENRPWEDRIKGIVAFVGIGDAR